MGGKKRFLCFFIFVVSLGYSEDKADATAPIPGESNQALMYRMLNSTMGDPSDIRFYRRWKKERKLEWLSNPKNLKIPGMIGDEDPDQDAY